MKKIVLEAVDDFLLSLEDDFTELWVITRFISDADPNLSLSEVVELTKDVVVQLIDNHQVALIDVKNGEIQRVTSKEAVCKVDEIFTRIKRRPSVGDGFWMTKS